MRMSVRVEESENLPVELFLSQFPRRIQYLAQRLREVALSVLSDAEEQLRPGWRVINYRVPITRTRSREVAWIMVEPVHVHLGFSYGAFMREADTHLEGRELHLRKVRYVTFEPGATIPRRRMRSLLLEAREVGLLSRSDRLSMALDRPPA
jgi:hypothetical protein